MQSQLNTSANDKTSIAHTVITLQLLRKPPPPRNVHKCLNTNSIPIYGCCDTDLYCHVGLCNTKDVWLPTNCTSVQYWSCHSNKINKCFSFFFWQKNPLCNISMNCPCYHVNTRHFPDPVSTLQPSGISIWQVVIMRSHRHVVRSLLGGCGKNNSQLVLT